MAQKDVCRAHPFRSLDCNFSFCKNVLLITPKDKKRIKRALSKQSKQVLFFIFWSKGLSFKTQFKIKF